MTATATKLKPAHYDELPGGMSYAPKPRPRPKPKAKVLPKLSKADSRTIGQFIAAVAAGFLPVASYSIAHGEVQAQPFMWALLAAALMFSAPTLVEWAEKWCRGKYKAWGFTVLLEGVMVFSANHYIALTGLAILVAINCNSAWSLAGKK